jgi:hypothetical protein
MKSKKTMENNPPEKARERAKLDFLQKGKYAFIIGKGPATAPNANPSSAPSGTDPLTGTATGVVYNKGRPLTRPRDLPPIEDRDGQIAAFLARKKDGK